VSSLAWKAPRLVRAVGRRAARRRGDPHAVPHLGQQRCGGAFKEHCTPPSGEFGAGRLHVMRTTPGHRSRRVELVGRGYKMSSLPPSRKGETESPLLEQRSAPSIRLSSWQRCTPAFRLPQEAQRRAQALKARFRAALSVFWLRPRAFSNFGEWQGVEAGSWSSRPATVNFIVGRVQRKAGKALEALGAQRCQESVCMKPHSTNLLFFRPPRMISKGADQKESRASGELEASAGNQSGKGNPPA